MNTINFPKKCCVNRKSQKDMKAAERELCFQLEDIVYELQDKAISNYEEASADE